MTEKHHHQRNDENDSPEVSDSKSAQFTWIVSNFLKEELDDYPSEVYDAGDFKLQMALEFEDEYFTFSYKFSEVTSPIKICYKIEILRENAKSFQIVHEEIVISTPEKDKSLSSQYLRSTFLDKRYGLISSKYNAPVVHFLCSYIVMSGSAPVAYAGLENQGATCYMNSLLQALYHLPAFRRIVYDMPTTGNENIKTCIPLNLQRLFCEMQCSDVPCSTKNLTTSFGWDENQEFMQHDVQEFLRVLLDNLETKMKDNPDLKDAIANIFRGQYVNYIRCLNVDFESSRKEFFYDVTLQVKGCKNLAESFDKYIEIEQLTGDNQYQTDQFGKQDAKMGVEFIEFPSVLHIHLSRFEYDPETDGMVKINDRYEFPPSIDLGKYLVKTDDKPKPSIYDLYGVLVHFGTVYAGHYYAYLRTSTDPQWYKFDDEYVSPVEPEEAIDDNFGETVSYSRQAYNYNYDYYGRSQYYHHGKKYSAYMLIYIRRSDAPRIMAPVKKEDVPEHLRLFAEKQILKEKLSKEERADCKQNFRFTLLTENALRLFNQMGVDGYLPQFMTDETFDIYDRYMIHPTNEEAIVNNEFVNKDKFRFDLIQPYRMKINRKRTTQDIYQMVADKMNVDYDEVRVWFHHEIHEQFKIIGREDGRITKRAVPSSLFYFQKKDKGEPYLMPNDHKLIFIKYFFPSEKLQMQFIGAFTLESNLTFAALANMINTKIGITLSEGQTIMFYKEVIDQYNEDEKYAELIEDQQETLNSQQIVSGSFLILQVNPFVEERCNPKWSRKKHSNVMLNQNYYYQNQYYYQQNYYQRSSYQNDDNSDFEYVLKVKELDGDEKTKAEINELKQKIIEKRSQAYAVLPTKFELQQPIPLPSFYIDQPTTTSSDSKLIDTQQDQNEILPSHETKNDSEKPNEIQNETQNDSKMQTDIKGESNSEVKTVNVKHFTEKELLDKQTITVIDHYDKYQKDEIEFEISHVDHPRNILFTLKLRKTSSIQKFKRLIALAAGIDYHPSNNSMLLYQALPKKSENASNDDDADEMIEMNNVGKECSYCVSTLKSDKRNRRIYFSILDSFNEEALSQCEYCVVQVSLNGISVQRENLLLKQRSTVFDALNQLKDKFPQIKQAMAEITQNTPQPNVDYDSSEYSDDEEANQIQSLRLYALYDHKYYKKYSVNSLIYAGYPLRIDIIPEDQRNLGEDEFLVQVDYAYEKADYYGRTTLAFDGTPFFFKVQRGETFSDIKPRLLEKIENKENINEFQIRINNGFNRYRRELLKDDMVITDYYSNGWRIYAIENPRRVAESDQSLKIFN